MYTPLKFQRTAIDELKQKFVKAWGNSGRQLPMLLKSPTGSGKTFMMAHFINDLNDLPNWNRDKAFIWITFSDDLAMQSRDKFKKYFLNSLENELLTYNDFDRSKLKKNNILFINWQKLTASTKETRVLRRPDNPVLQKESGFYFEDFVENTHKEKREIVLIVDEAHTHEKTELAKEVIDIINPKIIFRVTATPKEKDELSARRIDGFVEVPREGVVEQGLIKEKIAVQTDEDLKTHKGEDLDKVLLQLGFDKRIEIKKEYERIGKKKINPLMLIQLPNDDKDRTDRNEKSKEEIVLDFLKAKGVEEKRIALWFDKKKKNLEFIKDNESDVDFLLFKLSAGTGWDCPRAHVLVMFREIKSGQFYVQTVGRILRMAEPHKKNDYTDSPDLRTGFLYTNYERKDVAIPDQGAKNKPAFLEAKLRKNLIEEAQKFELQSEFVSRIDYGDLADSVKFQASFVKSFNKYFDVTVDDIMELGRKKLKAKGIELEPKITENLVVNAKFEDFDQLALDFEKQGDEEEFEISQNDVEKTFNYLCYDILKRQSDEDSKITNLARSWSPLKSSIRVWLKQIFGEDSNLYYRVFIYDALKGEGSKFRSAITKSLKDYHPTLEKILLERKKKEEKKEASVFKFKEHYFFTEDYKPIEQKLCVLDKCYLHKDLFNSGDNIEIKFAQYIDKKPKYVYWWFKNGDNGKDYYALKYHNTAEDKERLFYPDWIIRFTDGTVGLFETKDGQTLKTEGRASALATKLKELGKKYVGGIVKYENGLFYYCNSEKYNDETPDKNKWTEFESLF